MPNRGGGLAIPYVGGSNLAEDAGDSDLDGAPTSTTVARSENRRLSKRNVPRSKPNISKEPTSRPALREIANTQGASDTEGIDDLENPGQGFGKTERQRDTPGHAMKPQAKRGKLAKVKSGDANDSSKQRGRTAAVQESDDTNDATNIVVQSRLARTQPAASKRQKISKADMIPETQLEPMDVDSSVVQNGDSFEEVAPQLPNKSSRRGATTARNRPTSVSRTRARSASDTERGGDVNARRKLNEMSKRFEALELKYRDLKDIGAEGDTNFDNLKKQADEKTKAANDLIASLRAELATQKALASEASRLRTELEAQIKQNLDLSAEKNALESSLHDAQSENKTLSAKLSVTRAGSASSDPVSKVPGSAAKSQPRTLVAGSVEMTRELQKRQLKEDLYSDLTGLILRDVKRREEEGEDVYDCIQTGRNGTLHFHLSIANLAPTSYEDAEFPYSPLLDASRDRDLLEILPDYLTEEICFPRSNAAKFYARVVDCMTKKIEFVEE